MQVLMLSPEPPYPLHGGGAFRVASLLHYFARFAEVDFILISDSGAPALLPPGLVRSQHVVPLARNSRTKAARYVRNAIRALRGVPPLIDRLSGLGEAIERAIGGRRYDLGIAEHFWCAPYVDLLQRCCEKTVVDLHNIESVLHARYAFLNNPGESLIRLGHVRFSGAYRRLEAELLPRFSCALTTSEEDARIALGIAPRARFHIYPNSLPLTCPPDVPEEPRIVFSGNFEYHPNIDAVRFLVNEIWPLVRRKHPAMRLRLVGRGDSFIRHLLPNGAGEESGIEVTGAVPDAIAEIAQASVVIAPLRAGSGTRLKILEAWAAARCVVATPLAAEGLDARDDINIAIESDAKGFASRIGALLGDPIARQRLAAAGRQTFAEKYCWEIVWKKLDADLQLVHGTGVNGYTEKS